jgi:CRP/FNR family transcriptional regulator, cyclic AMP receptor protein
MDETVTTNRALAFNSRGFLKKIGTQNITRKYGNQQDIFSQGEAVDGMFYIQEGNVKLTVQSNRGKKAVLAILGDGDCFGVGCLGEQLLRTSTATTIQQSTITHVKKNDLIHIIRQDPAFGKLMISYLLSRLGQIEEDFVDQLFNSSEKRLARVLLRLAHFDKDGKPERVVPKINQEILAQMVGTTRSRVSHFMNHFRKLGFIEYNGGLMIRRGLLSVVPHDESRSVFS